MNIGLPGAGIGGLYYLMCTAIMPFKELFLTLTKPGHTFRYRLVATQLSIAAGIVVGLLLIYQLVTSVFGLGLAVADPVGEGSTLFYALLAIVVSLGLLILILLLVELTAFLSKKPK